MTKIKVSIIGSGSSGNCLVVDEHIMIDCGLPKKRILASGFDLDNLKLLLVTHRHSDHTNLPFIRACLKREIPMYLPQAVVSNLASEGKIDLTFYRHLITVNETLARTSWQIGPFTYHVLPHPTDHFDITNFAFEVTRSDGQNLLYATDLRSITATKRAPGLADLGKFDVLCLEGNYDEIYLRKFISQNLLAYGFDVSTLTDETLNTWIRANRHHLPHDLSSALFRAVQNLRHLSKQQARAYAMGHLKPDGQYYELHRSSAFYSDPHANW